MVSTPCLYLDGNPWNIGPLFKKCAKSRKINVRKINQGSLGWCPGVIRISLECFWVLYDDPGWFSEKLIFYDFSQFFMCTRERRVLRTPSLTKRECPKFPEPYPNDFRRSFRWQQPHVCILTEGIETSDHFSKSAQNREKSMFVESMKDHSGDV